jgi:hypothetical protein
MANQSKSSDHEETSKAESEKPGSESKGNLLIQNTLELVCITSDDICGVRNEGDMEELKKEEELCIRNDVEQIGGSFVVCLVNELCSFSRKDATN